jgi:hypothetical protein
VKLQVIAAANACTWRSRVNDPSRFRHPLLPDPAAGAAHVEAGGAGTLTRVSSKKRDSGRRRTYRQGVSGNPQRRAQQLQERRVVQGQPALRELAYRLAGGAPTAAWWRESYTCILARARTLIWPSCLVDLETQACRIVGDEFYDRLRSPGTGLHPAQWLRALAEETGAALRTALAQGADDWQGLWALLCGLALMAPRTSADTVSMAAPGYPRGVSRHQGSL